MVAAARRPEGRRLRSLGYRFLVIGAVLLILGVGLLGIASPAPSVGYARLTSLAREVAAGPIVLFVNMTDAPAFVPAALVATPNASLVFRLSNHGSYSHTFSLSSHAGGTLNRSWTPGELDAFFARNGSAVNATLPRGASSNLSFTLPGSWGVGTYEFVSLVPYQFQAGMLGFLTVAPSGSGLAYAIQDQAAVSDFAFQPALIGVNATAFPAHISASISNLGSNSHTWTLVPQADVNLTSGNFTAYFQAHTPAADVTIPTTPGAIATANFTLPAPGVYEFICTIAGHFANGMFGYLYVGIPLPSSAQAPSTEVVESWVLLGAGSILGVGVLLATAGGLAGRFPPKAPPQHHG